METWAIVALVLGSNIIIGLSTFFTTKMQARHSDRRFEKEHERAREADYHQRRWEVRGEPLLKLRDELAVLAAKNEKVISFAFRSTISRTMTTNDFSEGEVKNYRR